MNLLNTFGPLGGLLMTYAMLFIALMLIIGWEKHFFRRKTLPVTDVKEMA